jgi:hypothetical protein
LVEDPAEYRRLREDPSLLPTAIEGDPALELSGPPQRLTSNFINGINHLPLRWPAT